MICFLVPNAITRFLIIFYNSTKGVTVFKRAFKLMFSICFFLLSSNLAHASTIPINWFDYDTENSNIYEYIEGSGTSSPRLNTVTIALS
jgi:hypothetical protein